MKEVFTKDFWKGVKKTFEQALEDPSPADTVSQAPTEADRSEASSTSEKSSSPPIPSEPPH
jgi:hypothetical protein